MKKSNPLIIMAIILVFTISMPVYAHPGRLDAKGGHRKTADGTYHYHYGSDRTVEYSTPQNTNPVKKSEPVTEPAKTQAAASTPQSASAAILLIDLATIETKKEISESAMGKYLSEFPTVPNFGYFINTYPANIYVDNGIVVYQYVITEEVQDENVIKFIETLFQAGFGNLEKTTDTRFTINNGEILIMVNAISNVFSFTIGTMQKLDNGNAEINEELDTERINFHQPVERLDGSILIPLRYIIEKAGCFVDWDAEAKTLYINDSRTPVAKKVNATEHINIYVNNKQISSAAQQAVDTDGRLMIPMQLITEQLGSYIQWNDNTQSLDINPAGSLPDSKFIVYWGYSGDKVHIDPNCKTITNGVLSGTLEECKAAGHTGGWCGVCSETWTDELFYAKGNPNAK